MLVVVALLRTSALVLTRRAMGPAASADCWDGPSSGASASCDGSSSSINIWEEIALGGFAQTWLTARYGLLGGALVTAPLVVAAHLPLAFPVGWTPTSALINIAVLIVAAPFYR